MKPVDFFQISSIAQVHRIMHIPRGYYSDFDFNKKVLDLEWEDPLKQGIEIKPDDEGFGWSETGLFYNGQRVRLYIRDIMIFNNQIEGRQLPKYHITWCKTLEAMHNAGKYEKYVVSTSTDEFFLINWVNGTKVVKQTYEKLRVCKNCLHALNWKGYADYKYKKNDIYNKFSIEEFFKEYNSDNKGEFAYLPEDTDLTSPLNIYPNEWSVISRELRKGHLYCNKCFKRFTLADKGNLHVHHRNGKKNDCRRSNLQVLCSSCHQKEHPNHKILHF